MILQYLKYFFAQNSVIGVIQKRKLKKLFEGIPSQTIKELLFWLKNNKLIKLVKNYFQECFSMFCHNNFNFQIFFNVIYMEKILSKLPAYPVGKINYDC